MSGAVTTAARAPRVVLMLAAALISMAAAAAPFRLPAWPIKAASPDFSLIDTSGHPRTLADFRGKPLVMFFGFLHCPDACPAELYKLSLAMRQLGDLAGQVRVVFVTLDPERDTAALLQAYVGNFDARFVGLSGSAAQINRTAANFHVEFAKVPQGADYTIDHSSSTFLFDKLGNLRLIGTLQTPAADFAHDLALLARE